MESGVGVGVAELVAVGDLVGVDVVVALGIGEDVGVTVADADGLSVGVAVGVFVGVVVAGTVAEGSGIDVSELVGVGEVSSFNPPSHCARRCLMSAVNLARSVFHSVESGVSRRSR